MQVLTVTQVLTMEDGQQVLAVQGVLDAVYQQNTGENSYGPWSLQNVWLKDPADHKQKIKVKVGDHDPIPATMRGKQCYLACTQGQKGWTGLSIKLDEYKGKTSLILNATKTCEITFPGQPAQAPAPQQPAQQPAAAPQPESAPPRSTQPPAAQSPPKSKPAESFEETRHRLQQEAVTMGRQYLGKMINAFHLCFKASKALQDWHKQEFGVPMSEGQAQATVASFMIRFERQGLIDGLPSGDMTPFLPKQKSETK